MTDPADSADAFLAAQDEETDRAYADELARVRAELEKKTRQLERAHVDVSSARAKLRERISVNARLRAIAEDWLNVMRADGDECVCDPGDACPLCRCLAALGRELPTTSALLPE